MQTSKPWLLIAIIAFSLCLWLWYKRLEHLDLWTSRPAPMSVHLTSQAIAEPEIPVPGTVARVLTTIDWATPENPKAIPIRNEYLFDTSVGLQIWDIDTLQNIPLQHPLKNVRLIDSLWMTTKDKNGFRSGTLFGVHSTKPPETVTLYWLENRQDLKNFSGHTTQVGHWLRLEEGFRPTALVRLSSNTALLCDGSANRAMAIQIVQGQIMPATSGDADSSLMRLLYNAGVRGNVEEIGPVVEVEKKRFEGKKSHALIFNIEGCAWSANNLPPPLADAIDLVIEPRWLNSFSRQPSIVAASWFDQASKEWRTLNTPLIWLGDDEGRWHLRQRSLLPGIHPNSLPGTAFREWAYAADLETGKFAFLASVDEGWRESIQRMPTAMDFKLLPYSHDGVLALLIDPQHPGRIVRLKAAPENRLHSRLPNNFSNEDSSISLAAGQLMIVDGDKSGNASMITAPGQPIAKLPKRPQPTRHVSGAELFDGSVVIFGGLHPDCFISSVKQCSHVTQPSFRWIPAESRWQPLPELSVPFAHGESLINGSGAIDLWYRRNDFVLQNGRDLYYLSTRAWGEEYELGVLPTQLFRWKLGGGVELLAATRYSRFRSSLIELDDGRLAVIGGYAGGEPDSPACMRCKRDREAQVTRLATLRARGQDDYEDSPEQLVPSCLQCASVASSELAKKAFSSEIYDPRSNRWTMGPFSNHPGGRAVKLANGRLFKLSRVYYGFSEDNYVAETAEPGLTQWTTLPSLPIDSQSEVVGIYPIENQVLLVLSDRSDLYVIWDDDVREWRSFPLPSPSNWGLRSVPHFVKNAGGGKVLLLYDSSYEYLSWPLL